MTAVKSLPPINDDSIFDDGEALIALAQEAFAEAVKKAVAENDALGIPSPYAVDGKIYYRIPPAAETQR